MQFVKPLDCALKQKVRFIFERLLLRWSFLHYLSIGQEVILQGNYETSVSYLNKFMIHILKLVYCLYYPFFFSKRTIF